MITIHILPKEELKEIKVGELPKLSKAPISEAHRHQFYEFFIFIDGGGTDTIDFLELLMLDYSIHFIELFKSFLIKTSLESMILFCTRTASFVMLILFRNLINRLTEKRKSRKITNLIA